MTKGARRLYISSAIHKTHIQVDGRGTKAAATAIFSELMSMPEFRETKRVFFDKPFAYFILDENNTPVFMGKTERL